MLPLQDGADLSRCVAVCVCAGWVPLGSRCVYGPRGRAGPGSAAPGSGLGLPSIAGYCTAVCTPCNTARVCVSTIYYARVCLWSRISSSLRPWVVR